MRDYSQFRSAFWTGETGKALREFPDAQRLAAYLFTSPHHNIIGFYWLPLLYASREIGLSEEGVQEALRRLSGMGFAHYDEALELVWVVNMAREQLNLEEGEKLSEKDNRGKAARKAADAVRRSKLYPKFFEVYGEALDLPRPPSPSKAPSRPPSKGESTASEEQKGTELKGEGEGSRVRATRLSAKGPDNDTEREPGEPEPALADRVSLVELIRIRFSERYREKRTNPPSWPRENRERLEAIASWLEPLGQSGAEYERLLERMLRNFFGDPYAEKARFSVGLLASQAETWLNPPKPPRDVRSGFVDPAPPSAFKNPTNLDTIFGPEQPAAGSKR